MITAIILLAIADPIVVIAPPVVGAPLEDRMTDHPCYQRGYAQVDAHGDLAAAVFESPTKDNKIDLLPYGTRVLVCGEKRSARDRFYIVYPDKDQSFDDCEIGSEMVANYQYSGKCRAGWARYIRTRND